MRSGKPENMFCSWCTGAVQGAPENLGIPHPRHCAKSSVNISFLHQIILRKDNYCGHSTDEDPSPQLIICPKFLSHQADLKPDPLSPRPP